MVEGELDEFLKFISDEFHFFRGQENALGVEGKEFAEYFIGMGGILESGVLSSEEPHLAEETFDVESALGFGVSGGFESVVDGSVDIESFDSGSSFLGADLHEESGFDEFFDVFTDGGGGFANVSGDFADCSWLVGAHFGEDFGSGVGGEHFEMLRGEDLEFELVGVEVVHVRISMKFRLRFVDLGFRVR